MVTPSLHRRVRAARRGVVALVAVAAAGLLTQLPLASASFTSSTGNGSNAFQAASSFCPTPGSTTLPVTNDTMVVQTSPTTNYQSAAPLMVQARTGDVRRMFVRPTLATIPARCTLTGAVLTLTVNSFSARTYGVYRVGAAWAIGTINWNNQPAPTGAAAVASTTDVTFSVDVTAQVQGLYQVANDGLMIRDQTEGTATTFTNSYASLNSASGAPAVTFTWG